MHFARPPSAPPTTSALHARHSPVKESHHNHDSYWSLSHSAAAFATQFQTQPLQTPPSAVAGGARAASVSMTKLVAKWPNTFGLLFGRVLFNHSFIKLLLQRSSSRQHNHVPCMQGQRQQSITSRRRPRGSHATRRAPSTANEYKRLLTAPATFARLDGLRGSHSPVRECCHPAHIFQ